MKKAVSLFLCAIICLTIFTLSTPVAFAASYNGTCGSSVTWSLNTSDGTLTISGSGQMEDYSLSAAPAWERYQNYIKSVIFDDGVTYVGDYAFYNGGNGYKYKKLTAVDFGSVETVGDYAFRGCAALSTLTNCDSVTKIYSNAFRSCTALTDFTFGNINEICESAFYGTGLESLNLPETIRTVRAAAFESCKNATEITIPQLTSIIGDRAFADCTGVNSITFNANSVATGVGVFNNTGASDGLTLEIGSYVSKIPAELFSACYSLNEITGGSRVSVIEAEAFAHTGITSFAVNAVLSTLDQTAFADCTALASFTADNDNEVFSADADGILLNKIGTQIIRYPSGKTAQSYTVPPEITSIADGAFRETKYLKNFSADSGISKIPSRCFIGSTALESVTLSPNTTVIDTYAFANCDSLKTAIMSGVTQLNSYAFAQCDSLSALPTTSTARTLVCDFVFYDCDGLTSLTIPSYYTGIGKYAFFDCRKITSLTVPSSIKTISEGAFCDCQALTSVTLQSGITTIQQYAFANCEKLGTITVPSSVTTIGDYALGAKVSGSSVSKISDTFTIKGGDNTAAQTYATKFSFKYTIVEAANDSETILIDDSGMAVITDNGTDEEIDPMFTFDSIGSFDSVAEFIMSIDYTSFLDKIVKFIADIIDYIRGILCA